MGGCDPGTGRIHAVCKPSSDKYGATYFVVSGAGRGLSLPAPTSSNIQVTLLLPGIWRCTNARPPGATCTMPIRKSARPPGCSVGFGRGTGTRWQSGIRKIELFSCESMSQASNQPPLGSFVDV